MRYILNILLFFVYCSGLGYLFTSFIRKITWENFVLQIAVGLGSIPVIGVLLNTFHIPIEAKVFFCLSLLGLFLFALRTLLRRAPRERKKRERHLWIVLLIFLIQILIYCGGPFRYPYLEDDDPWGHAAGIKYIAIERNLDVVPGQFHYINPYPPGYDIVFALLHQTHPSLYWTMKFFNGLIVSLGFLFFYFFAKELTGDKTKSVIATLILSATPCYLSHFIWAHALAVTLFFPALTCLLKGRENRKYILPGSVLIAAIFLTQPTQGLKFIILVCLLVLAIVLSGKKSFRNILLTVLIAGGISLLWWGPILRDLQSGSSKIALRNNDHISGYSENTVLVAKGLFSPDSGSATRSYALKDYLWPPLKHGQMFNNPVGLGGGIVFFSFLGLFAVFARLRSGPPDTKTYDYTLILWLAFSFLGLNSVTFQLPIGLFAFRFWMLLAIPVSFFCMEGFILLYRSASQGAAQKAIAIYSLIVLIVFSGYPKIDVNTAFWPGGEYWRTTRELRGYLWLRKNLPPNTRVFSYSDNLLVIGHDMRCDFWRKEYQASFPGAIQWSPSQLHAALRKQEFEYLIVGAREKVKYTEAVLDRKLQELKASGLFEVVYTLENGVVIFRLV